MRDFIKKSVLSVSLIGFANLLLLSILNENHRDAYTSYSTDFSNYLFADSHGFELGQLTEYYHTYNFSARGDSYPDILRKLKFISKKRAIDTIYLSMDEHMLGTYREQSNNLSTSIFFTTPNQFQSAKTHLFERWIRWNLAIINPVAAEITRGILKKQVHKVRDQLFPSHRKKSVRWVDLSESDKRKKARARVAIQFSYQKESIEMQNALLEIISFCNDHGITIMGVKFPLTKEQLSAIGHQGFPTEPIAEEFCIPIKDLSNHFADSPELFEDQDHLNREGAKELAPLLFE